MTPLFYQRVVPSEKNGSITIRKIGPRIKVSVNGYEQGSAYVARVWHAALERVPENHPVKQVLLLGLGSGCSIPAILKRFPDAHVTAIEWDPAMVEVAKSLRLYPENAAPEIIVGDATEIVPKMTRTFDLILVDLFTGGETEPRLASDELLAGIARALEPDGYLLLNLFQTMSLVSAFERQLSRWDVWTFKFNTLALFRHKGQGRVGDAVPEGFVHPMQSPDYLHGGWKPEANNVELVGKPGCFGMRWHYGPIWIESYTTDVRPEIDLTAKSRIVIWQALTKTGQPAGWHRSWIQMNPQQHGFADIRGKTEYWKDWTHHAKRHRKRWLEDERYEIVEVTLPEFAAAYHRSGKLPSMRKDFLKLIDRRVHRHGERVHLFAARDRATHEIISGLAVVDLPDVSMSVHLVAFIHPKFQKTSVGTGIIDHWYAHCQKEGIRFPHFGLVWAPGDPKGWKGYSKFKRQFNPFLLRYPMPLIRFVKQRK